jgi:hypothetical protein
MEKGGANKAAGGWGVSVCQPFDSLPVGLAKNVRNELISMPFVKTTDNWLAFL